MQDWAAQSCWAAEHSIVCCLRCSSGSSSSRDTLYTITLAGSAVPPGRCRVLLHSAALLAVLHHLSGARAKRSFGQGSVWPNTRQQRSVY